MPCVQSARPRTELAPFVRAYAQRIVGPSDPSWTQSVPAQLEQILNLELGVQPGIRHRDRHLPDPILLGGAQSDFSGTLTLHPGVVSFAIFFWPSGWSRLFNIPVKEITDSFADATIHHGRDIRHLWNQLGEAATFERRVAIVDAFLLRRLPHAQTAGRIDRAIHLLFQNHGAVRIPHLGRRGSLSLRQFERVFQAHVGMPPKMFARIARFQFALDAKLANPARTWLDIAHTFGYYDQMHMIHDFELLGRHTPTQLLHAMGDVRPAALVDSESTGDPA